METKMLRWTVGIRRLDRVRNDSIQHRSGVTTIVEKLREARLRWYVTFFAQKVAVSERLALASRSPESGHEGNESSAVSCSGWVR
ncbi:unnamed protein product [Heligmosomoides polygyrus]|uniref:Transposase n=1 Tax=Heligmosomoides polygyrus TaxID=6339 RepID=A0A183GDP5_HELPZ|nr:unnamed protein product [Heligmosomoides polygyrus]